jgi:hypothetical protein
MNSKNKPLLIAIRFNFRNARQLQLQGRVVAHSRFLYCPIWHQKKARGKEASIADGGTLQVIHRAKG